MNNLTDMHDRQKSLKLLHYNTAIILGVGGIGSWAALNLALSGQVHSLILVDPDVVESSNLNRTPFRIMDIGQCKVDALKYLILERRVVNVQTYPEKTTAALFKEIVTYIEKQSGAVFGSQYFAEQTAIIDCRDDSITDFYRMPGKYYKIGYNGVSITIDGNPSQTPVWGVANGYTVTPSFICPTQLAANLVVADILYDTEKMVDNKDYYCDEQGKLNNSFTFDSTELMRDLYLKHNK